MNNLQFIYNVGLHDNTNITSDRYLNQLQSNKAIISNLEVLQKQISTVKSFVDTTITVEAYASILLSIALSILKRNCQAKNYELTKLTGYGTNLNKIRNIIYKEQSTEKGFYGTLLVYKPDDKQNLSILDFLERTLINYWSYLEIDYLLKPRSRFQEVVSKLAINISSDFYLDLSTQIFDLINNNPTVKKKFDSLLLDYKDLDDLQKRIVTLELDESLIEFFNYLYNNQNILYSIDTHIYNSINFKDVGGIILVFNSFIIEGLVLAVRYIRDLPQEYRSLKIEDFKKNKSIYTQQVGIYLALAYDAINWLSYVYDEALLLKEVLLKEVVEFINQPIISKGEYRIDG